MLAVGVSLLALGIGIQNPTFWIPGGVFFVIGISQKLKR